MKKTAAHPFEDGGGKEACLTGAAYGVGQPRRIDAWHKLGQVRAPGRSERRQ